MTLRDHQPDILFQGDGLKRGLERARAEAAFLSRNIALALIAVARSADPARKGAGRAWILSAQAARRRALADADAYRRLIAERDRMAAVIPLAARR